MKDIGSLVIPVLMLTGWFAIALATMVKLASMGGTLADIQKAEQARQASAQAPRVASAASCAPVPTVSCQ
jgi:hypothetical protein